MDVKRSLWLKFFSDQLNVMTCQIMVMNNKVKKEKNNFLLCDIFHCKSITKCNYDKDQGLEDICCLLTRLICPGLFASVVPLHAAATLL